MKIMDVQPTDRWGIALLHSQEYVDFCAGRRPEEASTLRGRFNSNPEQIAVIRCDDGSCHTVKYTLAALVQTKVTDDTQITALHFRPATLVWRGPKSRIVYMGPQIHSSVDAEAQNYPPVAAPETHPIL